MRRNTAPAPPLQLAESILPIQTAHTSRDGLQTPAEPYEPPAASAQLAPALLHSGAESPAASSAPSHGPARTPTSPPTSLFRRAASSRGADAPQPATRLHSPHVSAPPFTEYRRPQPLSTSILPPQTTAH